MPQNAVDIPVSRNLIGVPDTDARTVHDPEGQVPLPAPGSDIGNGDAS
jgi:hypothetical protein